MGAKYSTSSPSDQHYKSQAKENGVQIKAGPLSLVGLYVTNGSGNVLYLLVSDDAAGPHGIATKPGTIYPIAADPGDVAVSLHGGEEFRNGLYIGAYTTRDLAIAGGAPDGGAVMLYKADYSAPKYTPL